MTDFPTVAVLSDFGSSDWYLASMKGAILKGAPGTNIVDITHAIEAGNIEKGAFVLRQCVRDFPDGTVFLCVIDPGVGTKRRPIVAKAGKYGFVGPDNGLLYPILKELGQWKAFEIESSEWRGKRSSATFHGRDIFAPAAAMLASGKSIETAGQAIDSLVGLSFPEVEPIENGLQGRVLYFDHYGNGVSNFEKDLVKGKQISYISVNGVRFPFVKTFADVPNRSALSYMGSCDLLEIASREGSARQLYQLSPGARVKVFFK